jgi:phosphoglucosamine mutase
MGTYFGTDGIRGRADKELTESLAYTVGRFLGQYLGKKHQVLVGMDTRESSPRLVNALIQGVTDSGSNIVNVGVITTPAISYFLQHHTFTFGIMVSASHNPYYDNGIKIFNQEGEKLESAIENLIEVALDTPQFFPSPVSPLGQSIDGEKLYHDEYLSFLASKATNIDKPLNVLFDCAHGSTYALAKDVADALKVQGTFLFNTPNGVNINDQCGATHMETLQKEIMKGTYDVGISFDGDGDRMLAVSSSGRIVDGDALMYVHSRYTLPTFPAKAQKIVLTQMSNLGLKKALNMQGIPFIETQVGDKYVQAALKKESLILGGEQSGHLIFLNELNTGDGLLSMIKLINVLRKNNLSLDHLLQDFTQYPQVLKNLHIEKKNLVVEHPLLKDMIRMVEQSLVDEGRVLVRASGTEPLIRVMVEASTVELCHEKIAMMIEVIENIQKQGMGA